MSSAKAKLHIHGNRISINAHNSSKRFSERISKRVSTAKPHCEKKLYQVQPNGEITLWDNIGKMADALSSTYGRIKYALDNQKLFDNTLVLYMFDYKSTTDYVTLIKYLKYKANTSNK